MEFTYLTQRGNESRKNCSNLIVEGDHAYCVSDTISTRDIVHFDDVDTLELTYPSLSDDNLKIRCDELIPQTDGVACQQGSNREEYSWSEIRSVK